MRYGLTMAALVALSGCGAPLQEAGRPAVAALPPNCPGVMWTRDRSCYRLAIHRCEQGPEDQVYFVETAPDGEVIVEERRSYGLMPTAFGNQGGAWDAVDPSQSRAPDAAALLDGRTTRSFEFFDYGEAGYISYDYYFNPGGATGEIDGEAVRIFSAQGTYEEVLGPEDDAAPASPMSLNVIYVERAGVFVDGLLSFSGQYGFSEDLTPTDISFTGPISGRCTPR